MLLIGLIVTNIYIIDREQNLINETRLLNTATKESIEFITKQAIEETFQDKFMEEMATELKANYVKLFLMEREIKNLEKEIEILKGRQKF